MSYDILFVPRRPGQSWDQALDEAEGRDVLGEAIRPERMEQWDRIVHALRRRLGDVEVAVDDDACEASHSSGLQVSLFPDEAAVTFPYTDREDRGAFHDAVVDVVGIVETETGLKAWDAQTDEPFDGRVHDETGLAATRRIGQEASDAATTEAMAERATADDAGTGAASGATDATDAAGTSGTTGGAAGTRGATAATGGATGGAELDLQRQRALRYIVIGAVVVVGVLLLGGWSDPSTLSTLALVIGVADVVIGVLLYRAWARRAAPSGTTGDGSQGMAGP